MVQVRENFSSDKDQLELIKEMGLSYLRSAPKKNQSKLDFLNFGWECMNKS